MTRSCRSRPRAHLISVSRSPARPHESTPRLVEAEPAFPILDALDALDAVDLCLPECFDDGVVLLYLDADRFPLAAVAVDGAPSDDAEHVPGLVAATLRGDSPLAAATSFVVLGVVRSTAVERVPLLGSSGSDVFVTTSELVAWMALSKLLGQHAVELLDVIVLEPGGWTALSKHSVRS